MNVINTITTNAIQSSRHNVPMTESTARGGVGSRLSNPRYTYKEREKDVEFRVMLWLIMAHQRREE